MTEKNIQVTRGGGALESFLARQRAKVADSLIPEENRSGRILDIGCGSYPYFLSSIRFHEKHGLDRVPESAVRSINGQEICIRNFDIETRGELPCDNEFFDVVTMLAVIEHIEPERLGTLLKEIRRILKPGGSYILTTPAAWTDRILRLLAAVNLVSSEEIDEHKDVYNHGKIMRLLEENGFDRNDMRCGFFEAGMNLWAIARR